MSEHSVVAVFDTLDAAKQALHALHAAGFSRHHVTIVDHELESKQEVHGYISGSDQDATVGFTGALAGGLIGLALGVAGAVVFLLTPMGKEYGPILAVASIVILVLAGAVFGGLIGGMTGRGVKEGRIEPYDALVKAGKSLVIAHGSHEEMTQAQPVLEKAGAVQCKVHHRVTAPADTTDAV